MSDKKITSLYIVLSFFLGFLIFSQFIFSEQLVDIDYGLIRARIEQAGSFWSYYKRLFYVMDVQPVRDLIFSLIIDLERLFQVQLFGLFQYVFWYLSSIVLFFTLRLLNLNTLHCVLFAVLFLVHPISAWTLYWPTSLKHTLALFFITLATFYTFKLKEEDGSEGSIEWKILGCYFLAIYSQPICLLWGFFFLYLFIDDIKRQKKWDLLLLLSLCGLTCLLANYFYYAKVYPIQSGAPKLALENRYSFPLTIASFSRSYFQMIMPYKFAVEYSISSVENFVGLPLYILFLILIKMRLGLKSVIFSLILTSYPLILVYYRPTNIFISDTYLLIPLWGYILSCALLFNSFRGNNLVIRALLLTVVIILSIKSYKESKITSVPLNIFETTLQREPSCKASLFLANHLYQNYMFDQFMETATLSLKNKCVISGKSADLLVARIYGLYVFLAPELSLKEKELIFKGLNKYDPLIGRLRAQILKQELPVSLNPYATGIDWDDFMVKLEAWRS